MLCLGFEPRASRTPDRRLTNRLRHGRSILKAVHDKVSTFENNLRKKSLPLPAYILTGVPSDMRPVKLTTMDGKGAVKGKESAISCSKKPSQHPTRVVSGNHEDWTRGVEPGFSRYLSTDWGRGFVVVRLLASHFGESGSIPRGVAPGFSRVGIMPDDAAGRRTFLGILHSVFTSFHPHRFLRPLPRSLHSEYHPPPELCDLLDISRSPLLKGQRRSAVATLSLSLGRGCSAGVAHFGEGERKREILEKTRRPAAWSGTTPTCENPGVTPPGIEPGSPWWEASRLTARPPRPSPPPPIAVAWSRTTVQSLRLGEAVLVVLYLKESSFVSSAEHAIPGRISFEC
ncbi:hypothetical protein PR048_000559 [Dryococelus australis]|uniref:Uncharacterized protein n=1 Tax=Dryococelus australis TaxID=614101 RepID=A0ABQ9IEZ3_9NEOP|nr:hypothetical protein PR048_000559 [Dryococelus australis]